VPPPESTGVDARRPALEERPSLLQRVAGRVVGAVEPLVGRVLGVPRIGMAHAVYMRFSASSGPVLARGLAFVALFALVPALLAVLSVAGFFVSDPATRDRIVAIVAEQFPPLGPVIDEALKGFSGVAAASGIISIALLLWSASSLVRALDGAFRVVFEDSGEGRTPLRDVVAVAAVAGGTFAAALFLVLITVPGPIAEVIGVPSPQARSLASFLAATGLVALAYRFVPRPRPAWRMLGLPALCAGVAIFLLTSLYALLGPLLFGSAQLYGAFGALFLGLIWLGNVTQVLLLGAAWVAERDRRATLRSQGEVPEQGSGI
jgi:membrane protein